MLSHLRANTRESGEVQAVGEAVSFPYRLITSLVRRSLGVGGSLMITRLRQGYGVTGPGNQGLGGGVGRGLGVGVVLGAAVAVGVGVAVAVAVGVGLGPAPAIG